MSALLGLATLAWLLFLFLLLFWVWSLVPGPWRHFVRAVIREIKYAAAFTLRVLRFGHVLRNVKQTSQPSTLCANKKNYTSQNKGNSRKLAGTQAYLVKFR